MRDSPIQELLFHIPSDGKFFVALLDGGGFLYLVLDDSQAKLKIPLEMALSATFVAEVYFQEIDLMNIEAGEK